MKHIIPIFLLTWSSILLNAQDNPDEFHTLFGQNTSVGGYGSIHAAYTTINGVEGVQAGVRAAWMAGHVLAIGIAGNGFMNNFSYINNSQQSNLAGGYGGILLEPVLMPRMPVHLSLPVVAGMGGIAYSVSDRNTFSSNWNSFVEDQDIFLILEPGAELEFNVTRFFRLSFEASYRITSVITLDAPTNYGQHVNQSALQGLSLGVNFKFGRF